MAGAIHITPLGEGVERVEARALRDPFAPHRHDRYVVGITVEGTQEFTYRGGVRRAVPQEAFVLHPDERHDGRPGTDDAYGYRAVYLAPSLVADALGARSLPFIKTPVMRDCGLLQAVAACVSEGDPGELQVTERLCALTEAMARLAGQPVPPSTGDPAAMDRVREDLDGALEGGVTMAALERTHGIDRYGLARQFRRRFGVSPHRYLVLRRLDRAKGMIGAGSGLAETAALCGFADQSHMTRHFRQAFGVPPGRWRALVRGGAAPDRMLEDR
ncbi:MAG: AraC family transcriptional regulator [Pseudomonadota bacterium]